MKNEIIEKWIKDVAEYNYNRMQFLANRVNCLMPEIISHINRKVIDYVSEHAILSTTGNSPEAWSPVPLDLFVTINVDDDVMNLLSQAIDPFAPQSVGTERVVKFLNKHWNSEAWEHLVSFDGLFRSGGSYGLFVIEIKPTGGMGTTV